MKTIDVRMLDEKDEEIADALKSLGISRNEAKTLTYLQNVDEATSIEIEKGTGLHQPEVSVAVKLLKERDWINEREEKKPGKGRPYKIFSLKIGFNEIVAQLENQQKKVADEMQSKVERLKDITRS
jgi:predicted transcriptional regulator